MRKKKNYIFPSWSLCSFMLHMYIIHCSVQTTLGLQQEEHHNTGGDVHLQANAMQLGQELAE